MNFIQTNRGLLTPSEIEEFLLENLEVEIPTEHDHSLPIAKCLRYDDMNCRKILTSSGSTILIPNFHELRVVNQGRYIYKKAEEIEAGDNLVVSLGSHPRDLPYIDLNSKPNQPFKLTEEVAHFVGWYLRHRNLFSEKSVLIGNEKYQKFFKKQTSNLFEDDTRREIMEWIAKNFIYQGVLTKRLRMSKYAVVIAFINGYSNCLSTDETVIVREHDHCSFYNSYLALCRSVGLNCLNSPEIKPKYWNGFVVDTVTETQEAIEDGFKLEVNSFYKLNSFISK